MRVAAGAVVRLPRVLHLAVAADDDERVEVQGRAFRPVDGVVPVGAEGVRDALGVLAVRGEGEDVGGDVEQQPRGGVEDLAPEVEDERREDERQAAAVRRLLHHVGEPLLVERGLVHDPGAHPGVGGDDALQVERVRDLRDVRPAAHEPAAVGQGVGGVLGEARAVERRADEEHHPAVRPVGARGLGRGAGLRPRHVRVAPHPRGELGLARSHGTDDEDAARGPGEVEMVEAAVHAQVGEAEALEERPGVGAVDGGVHAGPRIAPAAGEVNSRPRGAPRARWPRCPARRGCAAPCAG